MLPKAYSYIRFSTPEQEKGDSLRRQVQDAEEYAEQNGLILDDTLRLTDRGLSAYRGAHRTKGALGEFLKLVEEGKIAEGSILIVESLDRLSRERTDVAYDHFREIVRAGIKVVTLDDKMVYEEGGDIGKIIMPLLRMERAHEESRIKSERLTAAWDNKRDRIGNGDKKKLTAAAPAWVKLSEDGSEFILIPEVAKAIELVFQKKLSGKGTKRIETEMNEDPNVWKPPKSNRNKTGGWSESYINKIIRSRAVIGEFQPRSKRQPVGEPIKNYFPPVIDEDLFYQVQAQLKANSEKKGNTGGRTGKISNLFVHIAVCSFCDGSMAYLNKGPKPKGGEYLICDTAKRGLGSKREYLRYDHFEPLILRFCKGLDATGILPGNERQQSELSESTNQLQAINGELSQLENKISNIVDSVADTDSKELRKALEDKANEMLKEKIELENRRAETQMKIDNIANIGQDTENRLKSIQELIEYMEQVDGQERIDVRLNLREQLRRLIKKIKVDPVRGSFAVFFHTGERRALTLKDGLVRDAYPKNKELNCI